MFYTEKATDLICEKLHNDVLTTLGPCIWLAHGLRTLAIHENRINIQIPQVRSILFGGAYCLSLFPGFRGLSLDMINNKWLSMNIVGVSSERPAVAASNLSHVVSNIYEDSEICNGFNGQEMVLRRYCCPKQTYREC